MKYKDSPYLSPMIGAQARSATVEVTPRDIELEKGDQLMPHIVVKLWPGKSENQKQRLADAITKDVMEILNLFKRKIHFLWRWRK